MKFIDPDNICKKCAGQGKVVSEGKLMFSCTHVNCGECQGTGFIEGSAKKPYGSDQYSGPLQIKCNPHQEPDENSLLGKISGKRRGRPPASVKASTNG